MMVTTDRAVVTHEVLRERLRDLAGDRQALLDEREGLARASRALSEGDRVDARQACLGERLLHIELAIWGVRTQLASSIR